MGKYLCEECKKFVGKHSIKKFGGRWLCKACFTKRNEERKRKNKEELERIMAQAEQDNEARKKEIKESQDLVSRAYKAKFPDSQEKW